MDKQPSFGEIAAFVARSRQLHESRRHQARARQRALRRSGRLGAWLRIVRG